MSEAEQPQEGEETPQGVLETRTQEVWEVARDWGGRPPAYDDPADLQKDVSAYLTWVRENPLWEIKAFGTGLVCKVPKKRYPTAAGCAVFCGVAPRTWRSWKAPDHPLKDVVEQAEEIMLQIKMEGAASGFFNSTIVARDVGLKDKTEVDANMTVNVIDNFDGDPEE